MFWKLSIHNNIHKTLQDLIRKKDPIIVEVGAHLGSDTRRLREGFPRAKIHCFEPDPRAHMVLEKYCSDLDFDLIKCAASDTNSEEVTFYQAYSDKNIDGMLEKYSWIEKDDFINFKLNRCGASSLKKGHEAVAHGNEIKVKTIRLDTWATQNNVDYIDLLWVDVQGAEKEVFCGAGALLKQVKIIWTEYGETDYEGGMSRLATIQMLKPYFRVINHLSILHKKGNLLLKNRVI
jgi:FkbM family methyltransferase